jgi:uncharacterized integral membrane protein (TIGR00698 family)
VSGLVVALLGGVALRAVFDRLSRAPRVAAVDAHTRPGLQIAARTVLRVGVVLLGLRLSWSGLVELGAPSIALVVGAVTVTFFSTRAIGRWLGLSPELSLLVAAGSSICGASAIAAVKDTSRATEEEVAVSISLVTACGTLALFALPAAATVLGLRPDQVGVWLGSSIQDVAQVVAAGSLQGDDVLAMAVLVKLTRVALLAPLVTGLSISQRQRPDRSGGGSWPVPWFIAGFLIMVAVRSSGLVDADVLANAKLVEKAMLTTAMVGIGSSVGLGAIGRLGLKPVVLALSAWLILSAISLLGIAIVG